MLIAGERFKGTSTLTSTATKTKGKPLDIKSKWELILGGTGESQRNPSQMFRH